MQTLSKPQKAPPKASPHDIWKHFDLECQRLAQAYTTQHYDSLLPLAGWLLRIRGKPFSLEDHWMFEPIFNLKKARRTIYKCARQVGKCVAASDIGKIRKADGSPLTLAELRPGTQLLSLTEQYKIVPRAIKNVEKNGIKPVLEICTRLGSCFKITLNHPLLTPTGYVQAQDLKIGDRLAAARSAGIFLDEPVERARIIAIAYMLGDGSCRHRHRLTLTAGNKKSEIFKELKTLFPKEAYYIFKSKNRAASWRWKTSSSVPKWIKEDNMLGKYSFEKELPPWVYRLSFSNTILFLSHLWATDGTMTSQANGNEISYTSTSKKLAEGVHILLNKIGILASRKKRKTGYKGKKHRTAYVVRVEGIESQRTFVCIMQIPGKPPIPVPAGLNRSNRDTLPPTISKILLDLFADTLHKHATSLRSFGVRGPDPYYSLTRNKLANYLKIASRLGLQNKKEFQELHDFLTGDITWDTVTALTPAGLEDTFDIEMTDDPNFVIDGIISHNTNNTCATELLTSVFTPYFQTLFICPRFEQIKRLSNNIMLPLIRDARWRDVLLNQQESQQNILQRSFRSHSVQFFSFAFLDAERIRNISADKIVLDEVQDLLWDLLPIIAETMSGSKKYGLYHYTGTPKTFENTIEKLWRESSMSEWTTRCTCGKWNIACLSQDLLKMIGKETCICAKCGKPLDCQQGQWLHKYPERVWEFEGRHISQITHPLHYKIPAKWHELTRKMKDYGQSRFYNECLGESWDASSHLLTLDQLRKASKKEYVNEIKTALRYRSPMELVFFGIDWGGGGAEGKSFTTIAVVGQYRGNDELHCIFGIKIDNKFSPEDEASIIIDYIKMFTPDVIAHDYTGAGMLRETIMIHAGVPADKFAPFSYCTSPNKNIVSYNPPEGGSRRSYSLDKARSLVVLCAMIRAKKVWLPEWESSKALTCSFSNLIEVRMARPRGSDMVLIDKVPGTEDDFCHSLNVACTGLWYSQQRYPNLAEATKIKLTREDVENLSPRKPNWQQE
jgi:intein/homing endonuclease